jgi:hypothetical protein
MTIERWEQIKGRVKDSFEVQSEGHEHLEEEGGVDIDYMEFNGPLGKMRLEFISKPVVMDKKTTYSRRIGSETGVEYIYSDTERNCQLNAYKWSDDDNDWVEMEAKNLDNF